MKNASGTFQGNYQYNRNSVLSSNLNKLAEGKAEKKKIPKKAKGEKIKQMRETHYESKEIE